MQKPLQQHCLHTTLYNRYRLEHSYILQSTICFMVSDSHVSATHLFIHTLLISPLSRILINYCCINHLCHYNCNVSVAMLTQSRRSINRSLAVLKQQRWTYFYRNALLLLFQRHWAIHFINWITTMLPPSFILTLPGKLCCFHKVDGKFVLQDLIIAISFDSVFFRNQQSVNTSIYQHKYI